MGWKKKSAETIYIEIIEDATSRNSNCINY
jgi:hypothetical protein